MTRIHRKEVLSPCCALLHDVVSARKHANLHERVTCMIFTMNCRIAVWANKTCGRKMQHGARDLGRGHERPTCASSASHEQAQSTHVNVCFRYFLRSTIGNLSLTLVSFDRGAHFLPHRHAPRHVQKHVRICSCLRAEQTPPYFNYSKPWLEEVCDLVAAVARASVFNQESCATPVSARMSSVVEDVCQTCVRLFRASFLSGLSATRRTEKCR